MDLKTTRRLYRTIFVLLTILQTFASAAAAQSIDVDISIDATNRKAMVTGRFNEGSQPSKNANFVFKREVTGVPSLASRIDAVELADAQGNRVEAKKLMDGEYVALGTYHSWKYAVDLTPPKDRAGYAHASWIDDSGGILMLDDLLPQFEKPIGMMKLNLPDGWKAHSSSLASLTEDPAKSVILIGKDHRMVEAKSKAGDLKLFVKGEWHFTDDEAAQMAREIFDEYSQMLGELPKKQYLIALHRFPTQEQPGHWEAETRGRTVTVFSSDMPFRTQSIQRLHEQLRHEIFHLWFPNGIDLVGDYSWFYEGFAMYSSLKLGVKLNRIRFEDFLDTLARAHTIDTNAKPRKPLTDLTIDPTVRYARGMMVAFLMDVELLRNSNGKRDVGKSLRNLSADSPAKALASDAVRKVVANPELIRRYVEGSAAVEWTAELAAAGIESKRTGRTTTISVAAKPSGRQKEILDRLGYNNWRKIETKK